MANEDLEKELKESIAYFEQILDVLPGERTALEFLCVACQQLGDQQKFLKHATALAEVIVREKDAAGAADLIDKLQGSDDPRARTAVLKLQVLMGPKPKLEFERPELRQTSASPAVAAKAEIALLERLIADGVLSRGLVQTAFDQLEQMPATGGDFLVSALLILEKENLPGAADALAAVADAALAPPVPLDAFELVSADVRRLPERLVRVRGVVPFAKLVDEWVVAVLNPLDEALREEIEASLGAKCHFFLAPPAKVEQLLERFFAEEEEKTSDPSAPSTPSSPSLSPSPSPLPSSVPPEPIAAEPPPVASPIHKPKLGIRRPVKQ